MLEIDIQNLLLEETKNKHLEKYIELKNEKLILENEFDNIDSSNDKNKELIDSIIALMNTIEHQIQNSYQHLVIEDQMAKL